MTDPNKPRVSSVHRYLDGTPRYIMDMPPVPCPHCGVSPKVYSSTSIRLPKEGELMRHGDPKCMGWVAIVADGVRKATEEEIAVWRARKKVE